MKWVLIYMSLFFSSFSLAQDLSSPMSPTDIISNSNGVNASTQEESEGGVTIVAVGESEELADKFAIMPFVVESGASLDEQKKINELQELIKDDFGFYKHWFEIISDSPVTDVTDYEKWKESGLHYVLKTRVFEKDNKLHIDIKLYDVINAKTKFETSELIQTNNLRPFGHDLANRIYVSLKGEESIFKKKIFFVSDITSSGKVTRKELYSMDFDGRNIERITYHNSMVISPAVSPNNKSVLYTVIENKQRKSSRGVMHSIKNANLHLHQLGEKSSRKLSDQYGMNSGAIFNHSGDAIYLTLSYTKNADIYRMDLKSKALSRVTNHFTDDVDPNINRDGSLMTFLSGRSGKAMIYTLNPHEVEKDVKRISFVGRFNASPRFSPDGKEIVFASWVDNCFDIYKVDADGGNLLRLTKDFGSNEEPSFSPDGQFIIFTSQRVISEQKAVQDIYIMNKEGEIIKRLTDGHGHINTPKWSN